MTAARHKPEYRIEKMTEEDGSFFWEMRFSDGTIQRFHTGAGGRGVWRDNRLGTASTEPLAPETKFHLNNCTRQTRLHRVRRFWARLGADQRRAEPATAVTASGEVEFTPLDVWDYLASQVRVWRTARSEGSNAEARLVSSCYVDAYQSVLFNLYGKTLPPEESKE